MKYYQLELVNREQNYNSLFASNPQVGLLDPFGNKPANPAIKNGSSSISSIKTRPAQTNRQLQDITYFIPREKIP